jgi:hypothetical protein
MRFVAIYIALVFLALIAGFIQDEYYLKGYFLSFLTLSSLAYYFIVTNWLRNDLRAIFNLEEILDLHVKLSLLQLPVQALQIYRSYGLDLSSFATNASAGDIAFGSLGHAGFLAYKTILSLFIIQSLGSKYSGPRKTCFIAILGISLLLVGNNHSLIVGVVSLVLGSLLTMEMNARKVAVFIRASAILIIVLALYTLAFSPQVSLVFGNIAAFSERVLEIPRVAMYSDIFTIFSELPFLMFTGLGLGSYCSRASFILSGTYLWEGINPILGVQMSGYFERFLLPAWNLNMRGNVHISGTLYQPFSFYATILAEWGVAIFCLAIYFITKLVHLFRQIDAIALSALIFFLIMCFVDNFVEYLNVASPFIVYLTYIYYRKNPNRDLLQVIPPNTNHPEK